MLSDELRKAVRGEVADDAATRTIYSRDYSIFEVAPEAVVFPRDEREVERAVRFVDEKRRHGDARISITARSAGTDMTGGPLNDSIILSFTKHFNHIKEIGDGYAVVEPGVYFRDFEHAITERGLLYPPYPASKDLCALGGIVSNNSGGEKTLSYGKTANYVEALRVVLSDGETHAFKALTPQELALKTKEDSFEGNLYRSLHALLESNYDLIQAARPHVTKNSAGYALWDVWDRARFDMTKLFVGAQGTLGIVTEARVRLVKIKRANRLAVIFIRNLSHLPEVIREVMAFHPETFESYDDRTLEVALRFLPDLVKTMKIGLLALGWQFLPELFMALRGGLPKMVMLVEFTSDDQAKLSALTDRFKACLSRLPVRVRVIDKEREKQKYWTVRRQSFALLHNHNKDKSTVPFIDDIVVDPKYLPEVLPQVNAILDRYKNKMIYTIAGHVGDGNFHIIPLMDLRDPTVHELIPKISAEVYSLILRYKGSITAEHNDGLIRTPYLKQMYGEQVYKLFEDVKRLFDPHNIFNPRKKVGGDMAWSAKHMSNVNS